jgi:hypothetical protein
MRQPHSSQYGKIDYAYVSVPCSISPFLISHFYDVAPLPRHGAMRVSSQGTCPNDAAAGPGDIRPKVGWAPHFATATIKGNIPAWLLCFWRREIHHNGGRRVSTRGAGAIIDRTVEGRSRCLISRH